MGVALTRGAIVCGVRRRPLLERHNGLNVPVLHLLEEVLQATELSVSLLLRIVNICLSIRSLSLFLFLFVISLCQSHSLSLLP